jgi:hypothetical protein
VFSKKCDQSNYYYETLQVTVITNSNYTLVGRSNIGTSGYLYKDHFDPYNPSNSVAKDDNDCYSGNNFKITQYLQVGITYVLVVTTWEADTTGEVLIIVSGPTEVILKSFSKYSYY